MFFAEALLPKYGVVVLILGLAAIVSACGLFGSFNKESGSDLLIEHLKKQRNPNVVTYLTPKEASKLQRK